MLMASTLQTERDIYKTILSAIFPKKQIVHVWLDDPSKKKVFTAINKVRVVDNKSDADILIIYRTYDIDVKDKKVFADGYLVFKHNKDSIVGGFYWQKGRPNLVFIKKNLKDYGISLPEDLQEYIEEDF